MVYSCHIGWEIWHILYLYVLYKDYPCCHKSVKCRHSPQSLQYMYITHICYCHNLCSSLLQFLHSPIWETHHPSPCPHFYGQPLLVASSHLESNYLWREDQTDPWRGDQLFLRQKDTLSMD
jgi:hypothetical protein